MGAKDNEEIIELTDVIEEGDLAQLSETEENDFPPEQAIDPKALEDEFEQLLQGSQDTDSAAETGDDLDIESLFDDLEKDTHSPGPQTESDNETIESQNEEIDLTGLSGNQDLPELDDLFNAFDEPEDAASPAEEPAKEPPVTDLTEDDDQIAAPETDPEEGGSAQSDLQADQPAPATLDTEPQDNEHLKALEARIAALEAEPVHPDQETGSAAISAFFEGPQGTELVAGITASVTKELQESARLLVEEKLASMDVPSSEEITLAVKEEINAAIAEHMPQPQDTDALIAGIREDLQEKVQAGMDAWETERIALTQAVDALRETPGQDLSAVQNQIDEQTSGFMTRQEATELKAEIEATLAQEIPAAAARVIREEIAALLKG